MCACIHTRAEVRGQFSGVSSLLPRWVPETELRWSDVVAFPETSYLSFLELDNVAPLGRGVILAHRPLQSVSGPCVPCIVYGHYFCHVHFPHWCHLGFPSAKFLQPPVVSPGRVVQPVCFPRLPCLSRVLRHRVPSGDYLLYKMCVYPVTGCGEQHRC